MRQIKILATEVAATWIESNIHEKPVAIVECAMLQAKKQQREALIIDIAGQLHVDAAIMAEIKDLYKVANPIEVLFVVDSMTGQDAVNTTRVFGEALPPLLKHGSYIDFPKSSE